MRPRSFRPPPRDVPRALAALESFIHSSSELPVLVQVGLIHAQFETIHPLLDGNGRVGRLLITFLLCQRGILQHPVLYLSHFFRQYRSEYYERLQAVRDSGDWEGWLAFFLRGAAAVSAEAADTVRRILTLREAHRTLVTERLGRAAADGHRVLESPVSPAIPHRCPCAGNHGDQLCRRQRPGGPAGSDWGAGGSHRRPAQSRVPLRPLLGDSGRRRGVGAN